MKSGSLMIKLVSLLMGLSLILGVCACGPGTPVSTPPPPEITQIVTTTATSPTTTVTSTTPISTAVQTGTPPAAAVGSDITVTSNEATVTFPDKISFALKGTSKSNIKSIALEYGTDKRSLNNQTTRTDIEFKESNKIAVSWDWLMKKTGSIPPGATVWWQWVLTDVNGTTTTVPRQKLSYTDTRFTWQVKTLPNMDMYWHGTAESFLNTLADAVQASLSRIQLNVTIPAERKPKVFVYTSSAELRGAVLFEQEWTGALAYTEYNIILTAVSSSNLDWAKRALPHEVTHLIVREAIFGPFGDIPLWLNEGLAQYSEGPMTSSNKATLDTAVRNNTLISIKSLASSFPTDSTGAYLAYAESNSVVTYLIDTYGWDKMRKLIAVFKDGSTVDKALQSVYSFDVTGLETAWKSSIQAK